jgi:transposase-like protein
MSFLRKKKNDIALYQFQNSLVRQSFYLLRKTVQKKKNKYSDDFKLEAVRMSEPTPQSLAKVAALLGIKPRKLLLWHAQYGYQEDDQYPRNVISRLQQEVSDLRAENQRLRRECAQLNKAAAFAFAASELSAPFGEV